MIALLQIVLGLLADLLALVALASSPADIPICSFAKAERGWQPRVAPDRRACRTIDIGQEWNHRFADVNLPGNSTGVFFETVERHLSILADLDEVAVGITHIATQFQTVIV